ncbi:MAG: type II toxin-antitoxin system RelE/ParE family toxin [Magnetococcales bacterium]|nr:type II toxin-antitoxin system RelE/ParE family toxin [Magnetococcales bacterium]
MRPAVFSTRARDEFLEAIRWIARENPAAAKALRDTVWQTARNLGDYPLAGQARTDLAALPVRFIPLRSFLYIIVYDAVMTPPVILRFLHGARDLPELLKDM